MYPFLKFQRVASIFSSYFPKSYTIKGPLQCARGLHGLETLVWIQRPGGNLPKTNRQTLIFRKRDLTERTERTSLKMADPKCGGHEQQHMSEEPI